MFVISHQSNVDDVITGLSDNFMKLKKIQFDHSIIYFELYIVDTILERYYYCEIICL